MNLPRPAFRPSRGLRARRRRLPALFRPAAVGLALLGLAALLLAPGPARAHPGPLDEYGGHFDARDGKYHYHRPQPEMSRRKREYLTWVTPYKKGELRGEVVAIERPDAVWLAVPYRPVYQDLTRVTSPANRDDEQQRVRVFLRHVAPMASVNRGKEFDDWFRQKVIYELKRKLMGKEVTAQFEVVPAAGRLLGMVVLDSENINLWMVLSGWSYYLMTDRDNPAEKLFVEAEEIAKREQAGLWGIGK